jgi:hypothetical protein
MPISKIAIGITYKEECNINSSIPLWLIIDGIFIILLGISLVSFKHLDCTLMTSVVSLFLIAWLIRGI